MPPPTQPTYVSGPGAQMMLTTPIHDVQQQQQQQILQTTDTPVVSAKMDGPDITPNFNKNKKK